MSVLRNIPWGPRLSSASGAPLPAAPLVRSIVRLPQAVTASFEVYVNGRREHEGEHFFLVGRLLVFERELRAAPRRRFWRRRPRGEHDAITLLYDADGRSRVAHDLAVEPY